MLNFTEGFMSRPSQLQLFVATVELFLRLNVANKDQGRVIYRFGGGKWVCMCEKDFSKLFLVRYL